MIFDNQTMLSDAQAIVATANSTNVLDLGPIKAGLVRDIGNGVKIPLRIQVVEAFNNLTSLAVSLVVASDAAFTTPTTVWSTTVLLVDLIAGKVFIPEFITRGTNQQFLKLIYTVAGTAPTTGKITAGVVMGFFE